MANEIEILIKTEFDPELVEHVEKSRKGYTDSVTGEPIPKGASYYLLPIRVAGRLINAKVTEATYQKLTGENEN